MGTTAVAYMENLETRKSEQVVSAQMSVGHQQACQGLPAAIENPCT